MRGYKQNRGYLTRLIFDAMKGQFVDMRIEAAADDAARPDNVVAFKPAPKAPRPPNAGKRQAIKKA